MSHPARRGCYKSHFRHDNGDTQRGNHFFSGAPPATFHEIPGIFISTQDPLPPHRRSTLALPRPHGEHQRALAPTTSSGATGRTIAEACSAACQTVFSAMRQRRSFGVSRVAVDVVAGEIAAVHVNPNPMAGL